MSNTSIIVLNNIIIVPLHAALTTDNNGIPIQADGNPVKIADAFDYGAGFVNPTKADDPGLIYDIQPSDYLRFFDCTGGLGTNDSCTAPRASVADLNLPSIAIPSLKAPQTVTRTVTNVGRQSSPPAASGRGDVR